MPKRECLDDVPLREVVGADRRAPREARFKVLVRPRVRAVQAVQHAEPTPALGLPFEILRQLDRIAGPHIAAKAVQPLVDLPDLFAQRQPAEQVLGALRR